MRSQWGAREAEPTDSRTGSSRRQFGKKGCEIGLGHGRKILIDCDWLRRVVQSYDKPWLHRSAWRTEACSHKYKDGLSVGGLEP